MVIFVTGKSGAGKTTYAKSIPDSIMIDGDDFRKIFPTGYSDCNRDMHIQRMAKLAALFESQGHTVVISAIMPKKEWRNKARSLCKETKLIYLPGGSLWEGTEYEIPEGDELK